ncbi:hypothetical protein BDA99DRAFT_539176 [Phascolomyces articulosus]|uniref:Uncharacterized protein n=1 Tax=Phascolomyces articulosus TaxID=60185 RepID=A0AAD5K7C0_9FUNG|nr:hypothetical protein BDA99DRAFT_539176 [Phascolomyces articulosus]
MEGVVFFIISLRVILNQVAIENILFNNKPLSVYDKISENRMMVFMVHPMVNIIVTFSLFGDLFVYWCWIIGRQVQCLRIIFLTEFFSLYVTLVDVVSLFSIIWD